MDLARAHVLIQDANTTLKPVTTRCSVPRWGLSQDKRPATIETRHVSRTGVVLQLNSVSATLECGTIASVHY